MNISENLKRKILQQLDSVTPIVGKNSDSLFNKIFSTERKFPYLIDDIFKLLIDAVFGVNNIKNLVYLDLGAGYGINLLSGLLYGFNCYGIEPSPNSFEGRYAIALELMKENGIGKPEKRLFNCYGENMDKIPDDFADVIYSYQVLEHVQNIDDVLKEVRRVLKPNGIAYFTMPNYNSFYEGRYEIFWIPFILSKSKNLSKLYLKFLNRVPTLIDELNFTTMRLIRRKAVKIFGSEKVYIIPWGVRYLGTFNKYIYTAGLINFYSELKAKGNTETATYMEKFFPFLWKINKNRLFKIRSLLSKLVLFMFEPFITDFRLIIISKGVKKMSKIKNPSSNHPNRGIANFLVYEYADYFLTKFIPYYKGVLVDLGCGEAPYKEFFLQFVDKYIGVDWSSSLHNIKADVISNLNEKINLPDDFADTIVSLSVLEHLCEPQVFLNEAFRILKREGIFILAVPFQWWVHEAPYDYFRFTPYGLQYMLNKSGFKILEFYPTGGFFTMWLMKINYFVERTLKHKLAKLGLGNKLDEILVHFYNLTQKIAPILDKLDDNWILDAQGYWVVCKKTLEVNSK